MKSIDKYLFQALDNYPYNLEETVESLDYALSYDDKSTMALCLYGRVYSEQLLRYDQAKRYFEQAIANDIHALEVYPHYIQTLLVNEDFEEAEKLIAFALTIKGINKAEILLKTVLLLERKGEVKKAHKTLKEVKLLSFSNDNSWEMEEIEKRLKAKKELLAPKKKAKVKKETGSKSKKKGDKKK